MSSAITAPGATSSAIPRENCGGQTVELEGVERLGTEVLIGNNGRGLAAFDCRREACGAGVAQRQNRACQFHGFAPGPRAPRSASRNPRGHLERLRAWRKTLRDLGEVRGDDSELLLRLLEKHHRVRPNLTEPLLQFLLRGQSLEILLRGTSLEILFRREGWQNLLDVREPSIEIFEYFFHLGSLHRRNSSAFSGCGELPHPTIVRAEATVVLEAGRLYRTGAALVV
ncbi:MAG TPA: hypothetical protein VFO21_16670 [Vicinamibacterales bacterium]|nr:hypothetical protein [Vicinamibacterales bacterium]